MTKPESELIAATKVNPRANEKRADFLLRLSESAAKLGNDGWEKLTTPAQKWVNDAVTATDNREIIAEFVGDNQEKTTVGSKTGKTNAATKPAAKSATKPAAKAPPAKAAAKAPAAKAPPAKAAASKPAGGTKDTGVKVRIKRAILKKPDINTEDLVALMGKGGQKVSAVTVSNIRAEFRHSLRLLIEDGYIKGITI